MIIPGSLLTFFRAVRRDLARNACFERRGPGWSGIIFEVWGGFECGREAVVTCRFVPISKHL